MPPKNRNKKSGKGKPSAGVDALSTEEMSKDQLEEQVVRLREELDREREERSYFQLERDKIRGMWEISRRRLEEAEAELRDGVRQRDEAAERHRVEITVYKQKLKHVLSEQHNAVCEMKTDAVSSSSLLRNRNGGSELDLQRQLRDLQAAGEQKTIREHNAAKELQLKHQAELMRLGNEYERQIHELEMSFLQRAHASTQAEDRKRRAAVSEVEQRMKSRMESLMEEHDRVLRKGEEYFSQIQRNQQEELDRWKLSGSEGVTPVLLGLSESETCFQEILESKRTAMEALQLDLDQGTQLLRPLQDDVEVAVVPPLRSPTRPAEPVLEEPGLDRW
ncbi:growth arrest-specific protein 8-like [Poecilia reticulata]|uniref:growth arrest-specific protein 8-like n=1 Tax=Poecilia reticulata TaxID=8081 RepID=UPI0007E98D0B|nr:PREDICTED: growth arrest-specific protein 8-like [Poecilia reticulata]